MTDSTPTNEFFVTLSKVLFRCWIFGFAFVSFCFVMYIQAWDFVYRLHRYWFGLSRHELDVIFYCGMGLLKLLVIMFFFIPWLAIRQVLRKQTVLPTAPSGSDS